MAVVGGYTLHLYCDTGGGAFGDNCPHWPKHEWQGPQREFEGSSERVCLQQARRIGWTFKDNVTLAFCPKCSKLGGSHA